MSDYLNPDQALRLKCVELTLANVHRSASSDEVIAAADALAAFVQHGTQSPRDRINAAIDWQPIATAPRDGRKVMLAIASDPDAIETGVWAADAGRWEIARTAHGPLFLAVEPTHWADLVEGLGA